MANLTQKQVGEIIKKAPEGTSPAGIVAALRQQGHTLEGHSEAVAGRADTIDKLSIDLGKPLQAVSDFAGTTELGKGIAASINARNLDKQRSEAQEQTTGTQTRLIARIQEKRDKGEDTSRLEAALTNLGVDADRTTQEFNHLADLGVSNRDVIGSAVRTGGTIASFGQFGKAAAGAQSFNRIRNFAQVPKVTQATRAIPGALQGLKTGAATGAKGGAVFGGLQGLGVGIQDEEAGVGDVLGRAAGGATAGAIGGAVIGGAIGGGMGAHQAKVNLRDQIEDLAKTKNSPIITKIQKGTKEVIEERTGTPDASVAGYRIDPKTGKVVSDKTARGLMDFTGLDEGDVAVLKSGTTKDSKVAIEMLDMADEIANNPATTKRPTEIAGRTFMTRVNTLQGKREAAGAQIDKVAREQLQGQRIATGEVYNKWTNDLAEQGISIKKNGTLNFKGSILEDLGAAEGLLSRIQKRMYRGRANSDAYAAHNLKRFIDEQVTFGKSAEGLSGVSERMAKGLRNGIDEVLDNTFSPYNKANTDYSIAKNALGDVQDVIQLKFLKAGESVTNQRGATVMNRLLSNAPESAVRILESVDDAVVQLGGKLDDSVVHQVYFARMLEDIYGVQKNSIAGRFIQGQEQSIQQFTGLRNLITAPVKTTVEAAGEALSTTPQQRGDAIRQYVAGLLK